MMRSGAKMISKSSNENMLAIKYDTALAQLVSNVLSPSTACGAPMITPNNNQLALKAMPQKFSWTLSTAYNPTSNLDRQVILVESVSSPIICAKIMFQDPDISPDCIRIGGANSFIMNGAVYVLSPQSKFFGQIDLDTETFVRSDNWSHSMVVARSSTFSWIGKPLDANGVARCSRKNTSDLRDFNPQENADNVMVNLVDGATTFPLRNSATFELDEAKEVYDQIANNQGVRFSYIFPAITSYPSTIKFTGPSFTVPNGQTLNGTDFATFFNNMTAGQTMSDFPLWDTYKQALINYATASGAINTTMIPGSKLIAGKIDISFDINIIRWNYTDNIVLPGNDIFSTASNGVSAYTFTADGQGEGSPVVCNYFDMTQNSQRIPATGNGIQTRSVEWHLDRASTAVQPSYTNFPSVVVSEPNAAGIIVSCEITITLEMICDTQGKDNRQKIENNFLHRQVGFADIVNEDAENFLIDDRWTPTVILIDSDKPELKFDEQILTALVVADGSPFTVDVTASSKNVSTKNRLNKAQTDKYCALMSSFPPALATSPQGFTRNSTMALQSRGIFTDIAKILGPLIGSLFPESMPFVKPATDIITGMEQLLA